MLLKTAVRIKRVVCGISGGVDSAVAALLLKKRGYEVIGVFMENWDTRDEEGSCQAIEKDFEFAQRVSSFLNIKLNKISFSKEYWNNVFDSLLTDYELGLTPNPDILCNRFIKFGSFYNYACDILGADAIATGHYVRSSFGPFLENFDPNQNAYLKRAFDPIKDQTLFLSQIKQKPLRKTMFPLGSLLKSQVRNIASENGMDWISNKKDSIGICFIGERKFTDFISEYLPNKPGPFVDIDSGEIVGFHKGVHHWTIGQRCRISGLRDAYFVALRDPKTQTIFVCGDEHPALYSDEILTMSPHWISEEPLFKHENNNKFKCMFKFQHTEWMIPCYITKIEGFNEILVKLCFSTRAITPGQYAVFYHKEVCLGGAKIMNKGLPEKYKSLNPLNISNFKAEEFII